MSRCIFSKENRELFKELFLNPRHRGASALKNLASQWLLVTRLYKEKVVNCGCYGSWRGGGSTVWSRLGQEGIERGFRS